MNRTSSTRSYFVVCTQIRRTYLLLIVIKNIVEIISFGKVHWKGALHYTNAKLGFKHCMLKAPLIIELLTENEGKGRLYNLI